MSDDGRGQRFGAVAEQYDQYRPDPPDEAISLTGDLRGRNVLDVGAGTGKLTRFLLRQGARVSVIEPDEEMRSVLVRQSPEVTVLLGSAESIPASDASFDAVFSSSAWHWFRQPDAAIEFARILVDNGALHVWWNGFSRDVPWMQELSALRERPGQEGRRPRGWAAELDPDGPFVDVENLELNWIWPRTVDEVVRNFTTYSGAVIQDEATRRDLERSARAKLIELVGDGPLELEMTLRGTNARRRPR